MAVSCAIHELISSPELQSEVSTLVIDCVRSHCESRSMQTVSSLLRYRQLHNLEKKVVLSLIMILSQCDPNTARRR